MRWYHTIELPGGVVTPGEYDLRSIVGRLPWPASLAGMRCLDVGSRDGFYAFEMERRGAAEVVSLDVDNPADYHLPEPRPAGSTQAEVDDGNRAFETARDALGSSVRRHYRSVYDITPEELGSFDLAVIGTLLLHLRDPVRALRAVHGVLDGQLIVNDHVPASPVSLNSRPRAELLMENGPFWWVVNPAGQQRMLEAAGFRVLSRSRPYIIPWGAGTTPMSLRRALTRPVRDIPRRLIFRRGALHVHLLAEPV
jgi:tRNA (mo5U34)-methyltransferase